MKSRQWSFTHRYLFSFISYRWLLAVIHYNITIFVQRSFKATKIQYCSCNNKPNFNSLIKYNKARIKLKTDVSNPIEHIWSQLKFDNKAFELIILYGVFGDWLQLCDEPKDCSGFIHKYRIPNTQGSRYRTGPWLDNEYGYWIYYQAKALHGPIIDTVFINGPKWLDNETSLYVQLCTNAPVIA